MLRFTEKPCVIYNDTGKDGILFYGSPVFYPEKGINGFHDLSDIVGGKSYRFSLWEGSDETLRFKKIRELVPGLWEVQVLSWIDSTEQRQQRRRRLEDLVRKDEKALEICLRALNL